MALLQHISHQKKESCYWTRTRMNMSVVGWMTTFPFSNYNEAVMSPWLYSCLKKGRWWRGVGESVISRVLLLFALCYLSSLLQLNLFPCCCCTFCQAFFTLFKLRVMWHVLWQKQPAFNQLTCECTIGLHRLKISVNIHIFAAYSICLACHVLIT